MLTKIQLLEEKALRVSNSMLGSFGKKNYDALVCIHIDNAKKHAFSYTETKKEEFLQCAEKALSMAIRNSSTYYSISL